MKIKAIKIFDRYDSAGLQLFFLGNKKESVFFLTDVVIKMETSLLRLQTRLKSVFAFLAFTNIKKCKIFSDVTSIGFKNFLNSFCHIFP